MKYQATPYFTFGGNAKEALEYYKDVFDGEIVEIMTFGEADFPSPPEAEERVIHAKFQKGNLILMVSDTLPENHIISGNQVSLTLELQSEKEIETIYQRLIEKGSISMKLQDTFWGAKFAKVKDPFGIIWDLHYTKA
ncbi:VOC family protein [Siminovitchia sp. FSL H7-0308]|uniref:PhnB protein n=1 Tax=Siminovitchia thermophila TaxID=1245522 RepID=A0ABS2R5L8_9BACI|nr:VOC family protein [Siminovitchia thermophila]MBM7714444.1 PhnB protein [Siminovitchia thermophila]ONK25015.1 hypothetical protein BLX87_02270 [Bacillus sp. VT-16-64]